MRLGWRRIVLTLSLAVIHVRILWEEIVVERRKRPVEERIVEAKEQLSRLTDEKKIKEIVERRRVSRPNRRNRR